MSIDNEILMLENINKRYILGSETVINALNSINLSFKLGEFAVIIGPSGSGKSTLLNIMGSLERPTAGNVFINGRNLNNLNETLTTLNANKATADAELSAALAAL